MEEDISHQGHNQITRLFLLTVLDSQDYKAKVTISSLTGLSTALNYNP